MSYQSNLISYLILIMKENSNGYRDLDQEPFAPSVKVYTCCTASIFNGPNN